MRLPQLAWATALSVEPEQGLITIPAVRNEPLAIDAALAEELLVATVERLGGRQVRRMVQRAAGSQLRRMLRARGEGAEQDEQDSAHQGHGGAVVVAGAVVIIREGATASVRPPPPPNPRIRTRMLRDPEMTLSKVVTVVESFFPRPL